MRERIAAIAALLLCAVLYPAVLGAQTEGEIGKPRQYAWEISPYVAAQVFSDGDDIDLENDVGWGARVGFFLTPRWETEISFEYTEDTTSTDRMYRNIDLWHADLNLVINMNVAEDQHDHHGRWISTDRWIPYVTFGAGAAGGDFDGTDSDDEWSLNLGAGTRVMLTRTAGIRFDVRGRVINEADIEEIVPSFGATWIMGGKALRDSDADTVLDQDDRCPGTPLGCMVDEWGCPYDEDGDTVCDGVDACPGTPLGCYVDARGCPLDSDGDGVCDGLDNCPGTPKGCWVDEVGCPKDTDGDTVCDGVDRCPDTPAGCVVDRFGCSVDSDGDGVCDGIDECPGTPRGQKVDERGCAVLKLVLADVYFKFNTATIRDFYYPILDEVARSMRADNNLNVVIELEGHTDSAGSFESNYLLAERRAKAVKEYLVAQGISPNRLVATSRGETDPAAPNTTAEGRARNRRVEMLPRGPNLDPNDIVHYRVMVRDAYFDTDKDVVRDDVKGFLSEVARVMSESRFQHVQIELQGFADVRRDAEYNKDLSERRAQAVKKLLVAAGLSPRRISIVGYGEARSKGTTAKAMQEDRRVEVHAKQ